jgi:hypothetical protein
MFNSEVALRASHNARRDFEGHNTYFELRYHDEAMHLLE